MKKFLTFVLVCCLVFSSSSTVFATATQWDTTDQANLRYIYQSVTSGGSLYTLVNNIYSKVNTISNTLTDIKGYLYNGEHSIAYWVESINSWMSPIYGRLADIISQGMNLDAIAGLLGSTEVVNGATVRTPYLFYNGKSVANYTADLYQYQKDLRDTFFNYYLYQSSLDANLRRHNSHTNWVNDYGNYSLPNLDSSFNYSYTTHAFQNGSPLGNIGLVLYRLTNNQGITAYRTLTGYSDTQTPLNWLTLENSSFTAQSQTQGIYKWLAAIQAPVARLSYVLASDERIEAQEKAADNEQAVVDNFIDSSGSGAASTSDFSSVSGLSSGFKNNISTDASVSGIWNIFNADNFGWFSQETADQLDTSGKGNKTLRSSGYYPTPLLDQQTEDIMRILGGNDND